MITRPALCLAVLLLVACSSDETTQDPGPTGGGGTDDGCAPGEAQLDDGSCLAAGTQPNGCAAGEAWIDDICVAAGDPNNGCAAGELALDGGGCQPAGVPPAACTSGFEPAANGGCNAILPAQICPAGEMAIPGETSCRAVAPCGGGTWGDIPVESTTQHVDTSHTGMSNGSDTNPWKDVQDGIDAAAPGAIVAIAAGHYEEDLEVVGKAVRLWGKCPAEVEVAGIAIGLSIGAGADGSEVRDLAVTSGGVGINLRGAEQVLIERVWIHDTGGYGLDASDAPPETTSLTFRRSLVEGASDQGLWISGSDALIEDVVVRGTLPIPAHGWGITILEDEDTFKRSTATIRNTVAERNAEVGVQIFASDVTIAGLVVRDTQPNGQNRMGRGMVVQTNPATSEPANVELRGSVIERNRDAGILVGASTMIIEHTTVRDTLPNLDQGDRGNGIAVQDDPLSGTRSTVTILESLVERASAHGLFLGGSDVQIAGVLVRDTQPRADDTLGRGASIHLDPFSGQRCDATISGSLFTGNHDAGVLIRGADVAIEATLVQDTAPAPGDQVYGIGIGAQAEADGQRANLVISGSIIEGSHMAGVHIAGADATIDRILVRDTSPQESSLIFGRGINIQDDPTSGERGMVTLRSTVVEQSYEIGVMVAGSEATLEAIVVRDTAPAEATGDGGHGIQLQANFTTAQEGSATIRWSLVEASHGAGLLIGAAHGTIESTLIRSTQANPNDQLYGDGVLVTAFGLEASGTVTHSVVASSARAGVSGFGANIALRQSAIDCNVIDLAGETANSQGTVFDDQGGNFCGCGEQAVVCKVLSTMLEAPEPLSTY